MRRFLLQMLAFLLLQAGVLMGLLAGRDIPPDSPNYLAETVPKNIRLHRLGPGKLILVGGSSAAFGFWSDRIEAALGRPVQNMGLAAGLGAEYLLAEAAAGARTGDVVVLSLEYDHFARGPNADAWRGVGFDPEILRQVLSFRPAGVACLGMIHARRVVLERGRFIVGAWGRDGVRDWGRRLGLLPPASPPDRGFNRWGDFVGHRDQPSRASTQQVIGGHVVCDRRNYPNPVLCRRVARFVRQMHARGVTVAWSFAPKPAPVLTREADLAERLERALQTIPGLLLLDRPADHGYPPEQFFDTANHLTAAGAAARTRRLIAALRKAGLSARVSRRSAPAGRASVTPAGK